VSGACRHVYTLLPLLRARAFGQAVCSAGSRLSRVWNSFVSGGQSPSGPPHLLSQHAGAAPPRLLAPGGCASL
jgi:hypothetical protein